MKKLTETLDRRRSGRAVIFWVFLTWMLVNNASTTMAAPPSIQYHPRDQTVILYQQAAFGVIASGSAPLSYQWRKDGVPIVGVTNDQVVLAQAKFSDRRLYSVEVSNAEGHVTSADARLTVNPPKAGDVDFSFAVGGGSINGTVESVAVQPDGKILIGGRFTAVHGAARGGIARLNPDGTTDYTFLQGLSGASASFNSSSVHSIALQGDGKVLIGGSFYTVNGANRTNIARLNADGTLDSGFQNGLSGVGGLFESSVHSIVLQSDGKVLIGGSFYTVNGAGRTNIARLNADGTVDQKSFQNGLSRPDALFESSVHSIALPSDGKVLIGGSFWTVNGVSRTRIARLNADGTPDSDFQKSLSGPDALVFSVVVESGGKILIGGNFSTVHGVNRNHMARLNIDGTLDSGFDPAVDNISVSAIAVQSDGKILFGDNYNTVKRLNEDGSLDNGFHNGCPPCGGFSIVAQSDGKVLIGGGNGVSRLNADGTLDNGFQNGLSSLNGSVSAIVAQGGGKVLIGGSFSPVNGLERTVLARLNVDGSTDHTFLDGLPWLSGMFSGLNSIAVQSDGKVFIGGSFTAVNDMPAGNFARLNADGTLDSTFQTGQGNVASITLQSDGKILIVGGNMSSQKQGCCPFVKRLNPDGTLDISFQSSLPADNSIIYSAAVQNDGKVLIGGDSYVVRLNGDGTVDSGFQNVTAGINGSVRSVAVQNDGRVFLGGRFTMVNGMSRNYIARLNADGTLDNGFQNALSGTDNFVDSMVPQSDGRVLIGGAFTTVNGVRCHGIARLNADGTLDASFQDGLLGADDAISSIALESDGKVLIGGNFTTVNGAAVIARLWGSADIPPQIKSIVRSGADVNLRWDALPNRSYRVQYKETVVRNTWTDLAGDVSTTSGVASKIDSTLGNVSHRFYRVLLLPQNQ